MNWNDVKGMLVTLAPTVAATLGTPLAGTAVAALESVFGLAPDGTTTDRQNALSVALSGATPDQLLALKKADLDHAENMAKLGFDNIEKIEALASSDRDSARKREMEVKDNTPKILAYSLVLGFFATLGFMLFASVPVASRDLLNIMLGMLGTSFTGVVAYYFGSSAGSAEKNQLLHQSVPVEAAVK